MVSMFPPPHPPPTFDNVRILSRTVVSKAMDGRGGGGWVGGGVRGGGGWEGGGVCEVLRIKTNLVYKGMCVRACVICDIHISQIYHTNKYKDE